ncbi:MAG: hypothetical protein ACFE9T_10610 [Promethearchaeota archaeon]
MSYKNKSKNLLDHYSAHIFKNDLKIRLEIIQTLKKDLAFLVQKDSNPDEVTQDDLANIIDGISLTQIKKFCNSSEKKRIPQYESYFEIYYFINKVYEKIHFKRNNWDKILLFFTQLFENLALISTNSISNNSGLPTIKMLKNFLYRDLETKSWELWFELPWVKYFSSHIYIKNYWRRRCNKIAKILIEYCIKFGNVPFKTYVLKKNNTEWKEVDKFNNKSNIDLKNLKTSLLNQYNINMDEDILVIRLLYRKYQFTHVIKNKIYNSAEFLEDLSKIINKSIKERLIKDKIELLLDDKVEKINLIYRDKITQYVLSILMEKDKEYIEKTVKYGLRFNGYYIIEHEPLRKLLKNISLIFKESPEKRKEINIAKEDIKYLIKKYIRVNKKFFLAKTNHVLLSHPNIILNYFDRVFDENMDLSERIEAAYWLGFIFADGYITRKNEFGINLSIKDKSTLYKFCLAIGANPTYIRDIIADKRKRKKYYASIIRIYNATFCEFLRNHGVIKQKSALLKLPRQFQNINKDDFVLKQIFMAFLLGYYDGDGITNKNAIISGSKIFIKQIQEVLSYSFKVNARIIENGLFYLNFNSEFKKKMEKNFKNSMVRKRKYVKGEYEDDLMDDQILNLICKHIDFVYIGDIIDIVNDFIEVNNIKDEFKLSLSKLERYLAYNKVLKHKSEWYKKRGRSLNIHKENFKNELQDLFLI